MVARDVAYYRRVGYGVESDLQGPRFEFVRGIVQTADGGFVLAGYAENRFGRRDDWLLKTDARGNMEWQQTYGGSRDNEAYAVIQTADGGYALQVTQIYPNMRGETVICGW